MQMPQIVSATEWQAARERLLVKEKESTRAEDALAAERRRLPVVLIDKEYVFEGSAGARTLLELFEGRRQLLLYHFMFAPDVSGWPDAGCVGCSMNVDQFAHPAHVNERDTSFVMVSRAPFAAIEAYKKRMGWTVPWYSSARSSFNSDFGLTTADGEDAGLSVFLRDDSRNVYRSYFSTARGLEKVGSPWSLLDLTPLGRQEDWEDSPAGWPQTPAYRWWRRHDEYEPASADAGSRMSEPVADCRSRAPAR
jgi:predicted dithiol-disulfide oxidoreductase (DUF899 family)